MAMGPKCGRAGAIASLAGLWCPRNYNVIILLFSFLILCHSSAYAELSFSLILKTRYVSSRCRHATGNILFAARQTDRQTRIRSTGTSAAGWLAGWLALKTKHQQRTPRSWRPSSPSSYSPLEFACLSAHHKRSLLATQLMTLLMGRSQRIEQTIDGPLMRECI